MSVALQGPAERLDYSHNWAADLDDSGSPSDTISDSVWSLSGQDDGGSPSPAVYSDAQANAVTSAWVRDLQLNGVYTLRNVITTAAGRTFSHAWIIRCGYR